MKKVLSLVVIISLIVMVGFMVLEPQSVKSAEDAINVEVDATSEISISVASDVDMGSIAGMAGGVATGETTWTVKTNENAGFAMTLKADADPALDGNTQGDTFVDYTPANAGTPDYNWVQTNNAAEFGFTIEPATDADTVQLFLDNETDACDTGSTNTADKCWFDFDGTNEISVISRSTETDYAGEAEKVKFKAQLYNDDGVPDTDAGMLIEDTYLTVITATVTMN